MSQPKYKLTYFFGRGLAEPIRQVLVYSGTPFEDVRLQQGELTAEKKEELGLEWGQVPLLEIDGVKYAQSIAIVRFLGRKLKLAGDNEYEEFKCDEIMESLKDWTAKTAPIWASIFGSDKSKLEEQKKQFVGVDSPPHLEKFEKLLQRNGKTWLVGNRLSYADIVFATYVTQFEMVFEIQLQKDYPAIKKLVTAVQSEPKIKEWIETRPKTPF